jgi:hypothetical protein
MKAAAALPVIAALAGCAPTFREQTDACFENNREWRATNHCQIDVMESHNDPMAGMFRGYEKLFDAKQALLYETNKARREGRISAYEHAETVCSLTDGYGCAQVHTITPEGDSSDVIVQLR